MKHAIIVGLMSLSFFAQAQTSNDNAKLKEALKKFPDSDANKDGVLTLEEAKAYKKTAGKPDVKDRDDEGISKFGTRSDGKAAPRAVIELCESQPTRRERVEIRRADLAPIASKVRPAEIVREDDEDVRFVGVLSAACSAASGANRRAVKIRTVCFMIEFLDPSVRFGVKTSNKPDASAFRLMGQPQLSGSVRGVIFCSACCCSCCHWLCRRLQPV